MNKTELIRLKKSLKKEIDRRNRINELLSNDLIQEFLSLNNLDISRLDSDDKWIILEELLKDFQITESNGILVCTGSYVTQCSICYQETDYYSQKVSFDSEYIEYQMFDNIETGKIHKAYTDSYIQRLFKDRYCHEKDMTLSEFCHKRYGRYLVSELKERYTLLNPYNTSEKDNGYKEVQKDFFITATEKGQPKAKQLVLSKYPQMK